MRSPNALQPNSPCKYALLLEITSHNYCKLSSESTKLGALHLYYCTAIYSQKHENDCNIVIKIINYPVKKLQWHINEAERDRGGVR